MMEGRSKFIQLPVLVWLLLLLSACASQTTSDLDQASRIDVNRESAHYSQSVGLRRMPPPHERGIESIAVLYLPRHEVMFHYSNLWGFRKPRHVAHREVVMPGFDFEDELLRQASKAPFVKLRVLTTEEARLADHISYNKWLDTRSIDETGLAMLAELRAKGVDQLLLVEEPEALWNFIYGEGDYLMSKGFLGRQLVGTYVFAGFDFLLIDTATGRDIESKPFTQASSEAVPLKLRGPFEAHTTAEKALMDAALRKRMANNIKYMLLLLKVTPGDDGAFLTYDPVKDKPGGSGYPQ